MKSLIKALQIVAVFCAYLVISIPVISATQISVFMPGGGSIVFSVDQSAKVTRNVTVVHDPTDHQWENVQVKVEIVGSDPAYAVKKIYLFKCKNSSPVSCSGYNPVEAKNYLSGEKGTFYWNDVSANSVAGFMSIVELEYNGKKVWVGFWDELERTELKTFEHSSYELDSLDLYAKPGVDSDWVKNFMENYFMVPMSLVERAVLGVVNSQVVSKMYKLSADQSELETPVFETQTDQGSTISDIVNEFMFVFGKGSIATPVTFYSGTTFECGDFECETGIGENEDTCCLDCGCLGDEECTVSGDLPFGVCHECGDGIIDRTENQETCCADAGCPAGKSCDSSRNQPYGTCVLPDCGNGRCDTPEEDVDNCCIDCGGNSACAGKHGTGYYCNDDLIECVLPECGNGDCEPGEDYSNCCGDCGGCPAGEYCNVDESVIGVCMPTTCGNDNCEPGEDYSNCCLDCGSCPLDPSTGSQKTCSMNICHFCGNEELEAPAESESTCCQDSGCSIDGEYCSEGGACINETEISMNVMVIPEEVDCTLEDPVSIKITLENKPQYFDYFRSAYYKYAGYNRLMMCQETGNYYECEIPVEGSDTFPGCFDSGLHTINLTVSLLYYKDKAAETDWNSSVATLSGSAVVNVVKERSRICNNNGACELGIGETPESCCRDCGCGAGLVCAEKVCTEDSGISMRVDETTLLPREQIDCRSAVGRITYYSTVMNIPYSDDDPFRLVDWALIYGDMNFTTDNLPGFSCEAENDGLGMPTGRVECSIPVSVFPACPYEAPAFMEMRLYVVGGGLSDIYGELTGMQLNDTFVVDYIQGLPNCGNDVIDDGETSENCCRDAGCPEGKLCSLYSGCIEESQLDLTVTVNPYSLNCSGSSGDISFTAEVDPKPLSIIGFENTFLNRTDIDMYCEPGWEGDYSMQCIMPLDDLPYCFVAGLKQVTFETTVRYGLGGNETGYAEFSKPVEFHVNRIRERECDMDGVCEYKIGELADQCCSDCGCTGSNICTFNNECDDESAISLWVDYVEPVDCSGSSGYFVTIDAEIRNQPYGTENVDWYMKMGSDVYGSDIFSCGVREGENKYQCEVSVYNLPLCHTQDTKSMTLQANVSYVDAFGYYHSKIVEDDVTIQTENWLDSCTNPITGGNSLCQPELGEDQQTCCQDCGCSGFGEDYVCTMSGCQPMSVVSFTIAPSSIDAECILIPAAVDIDDDEGRITEYLCKFKTPVEIEADVENLPYHSSDPLELFYYLDGDKNAKVVDFIDPEEKTATGWKIKMLPRPIESDSKTIETQHTISLGFTLSVYDGVNEILIPLESENEIDLSYVVTESDHLISVENKLDDYEKDIKKMQGYLNIIAFVTGFCMACFAMNFIQNSLTLVLDSVWTVALSLLIEIGIYIGVGYLVQEMAGEAWKWYAIGIPAGGVVYASTCPTCGALCPGFVKVCTYIVLIAVIMAMMITNKMSEMSSEVESDIARDIALANAEVGDDLSFYYE
jgi:hypothetical protein